MAKFIYAIGVFLVILFGVIFALLNAESVQLKYYFSTKEMPLSLAIILSMFVGAILGVLASIGLILKAKQELARVKKSAEIVEKELVSLRSISMQTPSASSMTSDS